MFVLFSWSVSMHNFVREHTKLTRLPFLPEVALHLADELIPIWERSEHDDPPFWAFAWAGGQALARYLLDHPEAVKGKTVLDIASGGGVVAVAAAQAGAVSVVANDFPGYAQAAVDLNASANSVRVDFRAGDLLDTTPTDFDVIVAGDVFYSREMTSRILAFLERVPAELVLVGDPSRAYAPSAGFEEVAVYDVPVSFDLESVTRKRARVLRQAGM
jgi:predicted nicotinamide N-methyase